MTDTLPARGILLPSYEGGDFPFKLGWVRPTDRGVVVFALERYIRGRITAREAILVLESHGYRAHGVEIVPIERAKMPTKKSIDKLRDFEMAKKTSWKGVESHGGATFRVIQSDSMETISEESSNGVSVLHCSCARYKEQYSEGTGGYCGHVAGVIGTRGDVDPSPDSYDFIEKVVRIPMPRGWSDHMPQAARSVDVTLQLDEKIISAVVKPLTRALPPRIGYPAERNAHSILATVEIGVYLPGGGRQSLQVMLYEFLEAMWYEVPPCGDNYHNDLVREDDLVSRQLALLPRYRNETVFAPITGEVALQGVWCLLRTGKCLSCARADEMRVDDESVVPDI